MEAIWDWEPIRNTITQENRSTTTVRRAVATVESVFWIPIFAKIEVSPAKKAEQTAYKSHIFYHSFSLKYITLISEIIINTKMMMAGADPYMKAMMNSGDTRLPRPSQ